MRRTSLIPLCLVALGPIALGGCSMLENIGGGKKVSPDEFQIVSHSPLTMPPNAERAQPEGSDPDRSGQGGVVAGAGGPPPAARPRRRRSAAARRDRLGA